MLDFQHGEYDDFKQLCAEHRKVAKDNPCYDPRMCALEDYELKLGPWIMRLTLDHFCQPHAWVGSVAYMKEIGTWSVPGHNGATIFEAPKDALMATHSWNKEEYDTARDLLGDLFGPIIKVGTGANEQEVKQQMGNFAMYWQLLERDAGAIE